MEDDFDLFEVEMFNINLAITRMSLASIHAAEGKLDAAIEEYSRVLEFDPNLYLAYYNRGRALWRKGEREKAKEDLTRAIHLEPDVAITYICRGDIFYNQGDLSSARKDYRKALELSPANRTAMERMELLRKKRRK
jgi:tetratricopeptide (TPR) repeat protein